jgi:hypothetical protein
MENLDQASTKLSQHAERARVRCPDVVSERHLVWVASSAASGGATFGCGRCMVPRRGAWIWPLRSPAPQLRRWKRRRTAESLAPRLRRLRPAARTRARRDTGMRREEREGGVWMRLAAWGTAAWGRRRTEKQARARDREPFGDERERKSWIWTKL